MLSDREEGKKKPDGVNSAAADETIEQSLSIKKEKGAGEGGNPCSEPALGDLLYAGLDTICFSIHQADVLK